MLISKNKKILNICLIVFILSFFIFPFVQITKAQLISQWWLEYKDTSGIHHIQGPDKDEATCKSDWTTNFTFGEDIVKDCFQSATTPTVTPETCTWPKVLDPTTKTCVNPSVTCTSPQVLDPKTNTCVAPTINTNTTYTPLASLPGLPSNTPFETDSTKNPCAFGQYLNILIKLFLGVCGVLAVIMIVWGGIQYMTSELASSKEAGKKTITNAILGLLLALGAFVILNTINPNLLNDCLNNLPVATITIGAESTINPTPISATTLDKISGIDCPGSGGAAQVATISQSFQNHVTYDQTKRHTADSSTIYLDCSSFVSQVYSCAGLPSPGDTSADMFNSGNASTNITGIQAGDILGWKDGESTKYKGGHVFMSLGGNSIIEVSNPPGGINANARIGSLSLYQSEVHHVIRLTPSGAQAETYSSAFNVGATVTAIVNNYNSTKSHNIMVSGGTVVVEKDGVTANMEGTDGYIPLTLTSAQYGTLKGTSANVSVWSAGGSLGTQSIIIN